MGNSLRCCLACVLPCGALDLIRIVHLNGYVEEITRPVTAGEVLKSYPNHVLSKPCSQGMVRKILILSSNSELKRGSIYFLLPDSSLPSSDHHSKSKNNKAKINTTTTTTTTNNNKSIIKTHHNDHHNHNVVISDESNKENYYEVNNKNNNVHDNKYVNLDLSTISLDLCTLESNNNNDGDDKGSNNVVNCDNEKKTKSKSSKSGRHQRRRSSRGSKSGVWQPHLECITEDL